MKNALILVGGLLVLSGFLVGAYFAIELSRAGLGASPYLIAAAYILSGCVSSLLFFAPAFILQKLEGIEARQGQNRR